MEEIFNGIKKAIIPIMIGIITYPLLSIFQYKGFIIKAPILITKGLLYKITSTSDSSIKDIIITCNISDPAFVSMNENERMYFSPDPFDSNWVNNANARYGNQDRLSRSIIVSEIKKGNYRMVVPVFITQRDSVFSKGNPTNIVFNHETLNDSFSDVKSYQWYDWVFFHRWWSALITLLITLLVQLVYKKVKKK